MRNKAPAGEGNLVVIVVLLCLLALLFPLAIFALTGFTPRVEGVFPLHNPF